jgi:hypothetical protein
MRRATCCTAGVPLVLASAENLGFQQALQCLQLSFTISGLLLVSLQIGVAPPGVFLQGLLITDAQGNVLHSRCVLCFGFCFVYTHVIHVIFRAATELLLM